MREILILAVVGLFSVPLVRRAARAEEDLGMRRLIWFALVLKLSCSLVRYYVSFSVYKGAADANQYHFAGVDIASSFRSGDFDVEVGRVVGSGFMKILTGTLYTFTGPSKLGGFFVFSWLGFWGLYFYYRAFCLAVPEGDRRRYARLIFFLPSLLFWPSSIGKEAWMTFTIGLAAYGASRVFARVRGGFPLLAVGLLGMSMVRPHIVLLFLPGIGVAYITRRSHQRGSAGTLVGKLVGTAVLVAACLVGVGQAEKFLNVESLNTESIEDARSVFGENTGQGGSEFQATPVRTPLDLPWAATTILLRPFPTEAHNAQVKVASLESLLLIGVFLASWRRWVRVPRAVFTFPYVAFACIYSLAFIYAFSAISNFGILTRQRVQLYPFVLVLVALPGRPSRRPDVGREATRGTSTPGAEVIQDVPGGRVR